MSAPPRQHCAQRSGPGYRKRRQAVGVALMEEARPRIARQATTGKHCRQAAENIPAEQASSRSQTQTVAIACSANMRGREEERNT